MYKSVSAFIISAFVVITPAAFAADVSVGGSIEIRGRDFNNLDLNKNLSGSGDRYSETITQERVRIDVNVKAADNLRGKVSIENEWDNWGRVEREQGQNSVVSGGPFTTVTNTVVSNGTNTFTGVKDVMDADPSKTDASRLGLREAWIDFIVPGLPLGIQAGHQMVLLGNGWFFRSQKYGSDAWVLYQPSDANTFAIVDVKALENITSASDDTDAYVILDTYKLSGSHTVGMDLTLLNDRKGYFMNNYLAEYTIAAAGLNSIPAGETDSTRLRNIGLYYSGKVGMLDLKAEIDLQSGKIIIADPDTPNQKFSGNQIVLQAAWPLGGLTINAAAARGSGDRATSPDKNEGVFTLLDKDQHYTLIYEYLIKTAAGLKNTGFANTTAASLGLGLKLGERVNAGFDVWLLQATEKVNLSGDPTADHSHDIGIEIDAKLNWKLYENLTWNWQFGYFFPGDAYKGKDAAGNDVGTDDATVIEGVLNLKF